ncbi:hypothetical protein CIK62_10655 [Brevibacterium aurantiacum]|uniref:Uncharacterized protein n=1 Tax=Brevibacterium aurantiacum TaxID=273384 RepID=A0A2A3ZF46_BREAU|nr:hypothetical protein CIK79_02040 [Brevibacterium aurantiacum]PCC50134.1 hypothetical protein CIK62_10655 [Brevibacterium aurantiacum]
MEDVVDELDSQFCSACFGFCGLAITPPIGPLGFGPSWPDLMILVATVPVRYVMHSKALQQGI